MAGFPSEAQRRLKWERLAGDWARAEAPAIPSVGDVAIFRSELAAALEQNGLRRVIVLGATWRLREIFQSAEFSDVAVYCIDWSPILYDANTQILKKPSSLETFLQTSWTRYDLGMQVGAIIGDKILDNLPFAEWPAFFERAATHLPLKGRLILHCAPVPDGGSILSARGYLQKWAGIVRGSGISVDDAASGLWEDLLTSSAKVGNIEDRVLCIGKHRAEVDALVGTDAVEQEILTSFFKIFGPSVDDVWCAYSLQDLAQHCLGKFSLLVAGKATDYKAAADQPIVSFLRT